jgi:hypothetical protein
MASETARADSEPLPDGVAWELESLRELGDLCMRLARLCAARAEEAVARAADDAPKSGPDPVLAFARMTRAVRMTVGLHAKIRKDRTDRVERKAAVEAANDAEAADAMEARRRQGRLRRAMSHYIVQTAIEAEERDAPETERLIEEAHRRFETMAPNRDMADFADIDVKQTALEIARALGADPGPDWWSDGWKMDVPPKPPDPAPQPPPFAERPKPEPSRRDRLMSGAAVRAPP